MTALATLPPHCPCGREMVMADPIEGGPARYRCPICWGDPEDDPPPVEAAA